MATDIPTTDAGLPLPLDNPAGFLWPVTVTDDDVDPQGHVNNSVYVGWMDQAAYRHSAVLGYDWSRYQQMGASFVVRRHEIDYLSPAYAGDRIVVATWPGRMERFTAWRWHQMIRLRDGLTVVRAQTKWIYLDMNTGRPRRMPPELISAFCPADTQAGTTSGHRRRTGA